MVTQMKPKKTAKYWKKKLKSVKRHIKDLVYENAAICDYAFENQVNYVQVCQEVQFLLKRLQKYEPIRLKDEKPPVSILVQQASSSQPSNETSSSSFKKPAPKKRSNSEDSKPSVVVKPPRKSPANPSSSVAKKKKIYHQIKLDASGQPVFPIELGPFTVHSLGEISGTLGFSTIEIIFPIGYCSTRLYTSTRNPKQECLYICLIKESHGHPRFEISADNEPNMPIVGNSPDECHYYLLQRLGLMRAQPKGIEFFGLSHPTVHYLIQSSPNAKKCGNYVFTKFEVSKTGKEDPAENSNDFRLNHKGFLKHIELIEAAKVPR